MKGVKDIYSFEGDGDLGDGVGEDSDGSDSDLDDEEHGTQMNEDITIELDEKSVQISSHLT